MKNINMKFKVEVGRLLKEIKDYQGIKSEYCKNNIKISNINDNSNWEDPYEKYDSLQDIKVKKKIDYYQIRF